MRHYPVFIDLSGKSLLVLGLGQVGRRKLASMLECSPDKVLALDPGLPAAPEAAVQDLLDEPCVVYARRPFAESDLDGVFLAVAASGDREANRKLANACRNRNVLCNVVDAPEEGDVIIPATARAGGVAAALSTGGASPALARRLRRELEQTLAQKYAPLAALMGRLRPLVLDMNMPQHDNAALFRALADSRLPELLAAEPAAAREELLRILPARLHPHMEDLLHGLV